MKSLYPLLIVALTLFFSSCSSSINELERDLYVKRDSLVLYLNFEDPNIIDQSDKDNSCEIFGAKIMSDRRPNSNSFIYFDGIDDYIRIKDADHLTPLDQKLTIAYWVKVSFPGNKFILYKGNNLYNREYACGVRSDSLFSFQINNNGDALNIGSLMGQSILLENTWYHITCVWDGSTQKMYINGNFNNEQVSDIEITNCNSDLFIGTYGGRAFEYAFNGAIDNLVIFNRVLDDEEIKLLSNDKIK